ncbi:MAG: TlpA disulfide reductase family protein [Candidatus Thiodiazotropha sp.]
MMHSIRPDYLDYLKAVIIVALTASGPVSAGWLEAVTPVQRAPSLKLEDLAGVKYELKGLKGKTVLVNFWTTWCPPCIEEMPSLIGLNREMEQGGFVILAVNVEERKRRVGNFASRLKLTFPVLLDPGREAGDTWEVKVFPSSFLVDPEGRLRYRAIGPIDWNSDEVISIIRRLAVE